MDEPRRWLDDPELPEAMRAALEAGKDELPREDQLEQLAARLGPLLLPPGGGGGGGLDPTGGGGGAAATAGLSSGAKLSLGALAVAAVLGGGALVWPTEPPAPRAPIPEASPSATVDPAPSPDALPEGVDLPEPASDPPPPGPTRARAEVAPPGPSFEVNPAAELTVIRSAQVAMRADPARALRFTDEHLRRFGPGTLEQEREVLAVDALMRLGRRDEALARADRFVARWPRSAHTRRIEVLTRGAPGGR